MSGPTAAPSIERSFHPGAHTCRGAGPIRIDLRHQEIPLDQTHVEARRPAGVTSRVRRTVSGCGQQCKVGLPQPAEHVADDRSELADRSGGRGLGTELLVHRVPVHAVQGLVEV